MAQSKETLSFPMNSMVDLSIVILHDVVCLPERTNGDWADDNTAYTIHMVIRGNHENFWLVFW